MSIDFFSYIDLKKSPQPEVVTRAYGELIAALRQAQDAESWHAALQEYMAEARGWIAAGIVGGFNAAGVLFVGHALQAGYKAVGREGGVRVLGFVLQLSMTQSQWIDALKAMAANGGSVSTEQDVLRVDQFPSTILNYLFKRGQADILGEIFRGARLAIDTAARQAMSGSRDFDGWMADLVVLAAYLTMRRWLPLMIKAEGVEGDMGRIELFGEGESEMGEGRFVPPPQVENPVLAHLFQRDEIDALHRKEAYAAECFAHLYASVMNGYVSPQHQQQIADEYARRASASRLDARQWLALGKSRFEIAPYIQ